MRLTTRSRFAVTAMLELAISQKGVVSLSVISERHNLSVSYLEQLFLKLRKRSLVSGVRGPSGGYYLLKPADQITIADIISAVDEVLDATNCKGNINCNKNINGKPVKCITHDLWSSFNYKMFEYLNSISLQNLLDCNNKVFQNKKSNLSNYVKNSLSTVDDIVFIR
ncbi:Rrf2 family transcriptional regulator, iron-sulfur cluster assembly [Candidatus Kinetoplastibacterium desouzaii TCC079E]|uniref:Rrf2 family transcriptional regulator, iron-sulfur cluster assembly n=1 Tax=Candidatus Kinetoplastidibacterium desouzai TCC079E TaxID=1208919 RepID=M1LU41_9PROT|nr:Rrf2 family transcriptional regulator [Candidatus Kinetoplastibacterium desouzaii]AGF46804.1 Rrf2 family transcriptional regulator, iron-sulfur cluster assembly [Candidatus Kinetoplastibacterium desouzaii TCC079E]